MTRRQIDTALKRIHQLAEQDNFLEASIRLYHLNLNLLRAISIHIKTEKASKAVKPKELVKLIITNINEDHFQKGIINNKNLKLLKPWIELTDRFFKDMRIAYPKDIQTFYAHNEKIFALLQMSIVKMRSRE